MSQPEFVSATPAQLDELLALARAASFPEEKYRLLEGVLETFAYVMLKLQNAKTSLRRFRQMLFGARTQSKRNVLKQNTGGEAGQSNDDNRAQASPSEHAVVPAQDRPCTPAKRAGHGRAGAHAYSGATVIAVEHPYLKPGDPCPQCPRGKVYAYELKKLVTVVGQPPLAASLYELQRLRCRLCDAMFTAALPEQAGPHKYDESCASMIALLRYGSGVPFFRLEGLQASLHVPLPDATGVGYRGSGGRGAAPGLCGAHPAGRSGASSAQR
jgi:transposase